MSTTKQRLADPSPRVGDPVRYRAESGAKHWGQIVDLCHCQPCDTSSQRRYVLDLDVDGTGVRVEHVPGRLFTPDRRGAHRNAKGAPGQCLNDSDR